MIERWHRTLKAAICCKDTTNWSDNLPLILLGLRTAYKSDINASPAELVYGDTLCIPAQFFAEQPYRPTEDYTEYRRRLNEALAQIQPTATAWHTEKPTFVHSSLTTCTHVFVRNDTVRPALTPPYQGPFQVLTRTPKFFQVSVNGKATSISIDRLKPAYSAGPEAPPTPPPPPTSPSLPTPPPPPTATPPPAAATPSAKLHPAPLPG
ncbi:uncharacterized protein LOC131214703, partial [Anopheles bellator]|uniref:uncharacterized protein LOC131214703 n=1 Tax=Anopheles bellator TaxID=139047 RepID=UPI0026470AE8